MRTSTTLILATALAAIFTPRAASAHAEYVQYIPNASALNCSYCHVPGDTTKLDDMGYDTVPIVGKPVKDWWPALRGLDSDGDGQTNGQELGDPCEEWLMGLKPGRTTDISNPSDPASKSATPDVPSCDPTPGTGGGGGAGGGEGGGTPTTGNAGSGTTSGTASGAGSSGPSGGQGASTPASAGAGKADDPVLTNQNEACATGPLSHGSGGALLFLAAAAFLTARSRRHRTR